MGSTGCGVAAAGAVARRRSKRSRFPRPLPAFASIAWQATMSRRNAPSRQGASTAGVRGTAHSPAPCLLGPQGANGRTRHRRRGGCVPVLMRRMMTRLPRGLPPRDAHRRFPAAALHRLHPHHRLKTGVAPRAWRRQLPDQRVARRGRVALSLLSSLALRSYRLLRTSWAWPLSLVLVVPGPWCRRPWSASFCLTILGWELRMPRSSAMTLRTLLCVSSVARIRTGYSTPRRWVLSSPYSGIRGGGPRWLLVGPSGTGCW